MLLFKSLKSGKSTGDVERFFLGVSERDDVNLKMRYTHWILRVYSWCSLFLKCFRNPYTPKKRLTWNPNIKVWFQMILLLLPVVGRSCPVPPWGRSSPARGATLMRMLMCWHPGPTSERSFWRSGRVTSDQLTLVSCYICIYSLTQPMANLSLNFWGWLIFSSWNGFIS